MSKTVLITGATGMINIGLKEKTASSVFSNAEIKRYIST